MEGHIIQNENLIKFMLAGKARFTMIGESHRFTYFILQPKYQGVLCQTQRYVKVADSKRGNDMTYIGLLKFKNGIWNYEFRQPRSIEHIDLPGKFTTDSIEVKSFNHVFYHAVRGRFSDKVQVWNEGLCACCGRPLTTPESMVIGWGPACLKKLRAKEFESETQAQFEAR